MVVDYRQLSEEALQGLIEAFVCQEGTDYGVIEYSLEEKVHQVKQQLINKEAVVIYDEQSESATIAHAKPL